MEKKKFWLVDTGAVQTRPEEVTCIIDGDENIVAYTRSDDGRVGYIAYDGKQDHIFNTKREADMFAVAHNNDKIQIVEAYSELYDKNCELKVDKERLEQENADLKGEIEYLKDENEKLKANGNCGQDSEKKMSIRGPLKGMMVKDGVLSINGRIIKKTGDNVKITVEGNVDMITTEAGDVEVKGDCGSVKTMSGDITVGQDVKGSASTMSGDVIVRGQVGDRCSTMSGDICRGK